MLFVQLLAAESPRDTPHRTEPTDSPARIRPLEDPADPLAMAAQTITETRNHDEYTVGWVCALSKEQTAATAMLDQRHTDLPKPPNDPNAYTLGSIGKHNIVIACLPEGEIGTHAVATIATWMISTFPLIKLGLMVGIGGGIPPKVRLGDVVVSTPAGQYPGVVQWDFGKAEEGGNFKRTGSLNNLPTSLRTALTKLRTENELNGSKIPKYLDELKQKWPRLAPKYLRTESLEDVLFKADYGHVSENTLNCDVTPDSDDGEEEEAEEESCKFCDRAKIVKRKIRDMRVHYGLIASGNRVIKDASFRNRLKKVLDGHVLCVEMEAAGLMNNFPCIVIRGICDYADSHKNKDWQEHAAAVAAAFAKELLEYVQPGDVSGERPVKEILSQVLDDTSAIRENTTHTRAKLDRKEDVEILDWLTPIDYGPQQSDYFSTRQPATGNWLLQSEEFLYWLAASKQTLFCPGMPGAGKTILTSIVVDSLNSKFDNDSEIGIAYIYCNFRRQHEQKIGDLLASVLKQLTQCRSSLPDSVKSLYDWHKTKRTRPSVDEILGLLQSVAAMHSRVFVIIDALDECLASDGCRTRFLSELFNLQVRHGINIFATSRFIPEIMDRFETSLSIEIRASPDDMARYLKGHIEQLPSFVQHDRQLQEEITTGISEAVDGMFLLAQLYLGLLGDKLTLNDIRSAIETFQKQSQRSGEDQKVQVLARAYGQAMERINGQMPGKKELAMKVLSWITCAKRQLTTSELQHALATKTGESELDLRDLPHIGDMVSVCAGLVTVDEESGVIRLVHHTTQEYLKRTQEQWFRDPESVITTTCVTYLSFSVFETGPCTTDHKFEERLRLNPFYDYAAHNWGHHAPKDMAPSEEVISFLKSQAKVEASCQALMAAKQYSPHSQETPRKMTGLHLAGFFGLSKAADKLIRLGHSPDLKDTYSRTPLWYAAQNGHKAVVKLLVVAGADVNTAAAWLDGRTALQAASGGGHLEIVERLLAAGADVNAAAAGNGGRTALQAASEGGHLEVIKKLLAAGANVNGAAAEYRGRTALQAACRGGHLEIVEKLLVAGADVNATAAAGSDRRTALQAASEGGYLEIIERLLVAGADVNAAAAGNRGRTALQAASERGYLEIVEKLLAAGADINAAAAAGNGGRTVLQAASGGGHPEVVEKLLAAGADVNAIAAAGSDRRTALQAASEGGHLEVIKKLLAAGADVDGAAVGYRGRTALQAASGGGHLEIIERLLAAGADVNAIAAAGSDRRTALQAASEGGHLEVIEKLLAAGADVDSAAAGYRGRTALQAACRGGHLEVVEKLLAAGADVDGAAAGYRGRTALQAASEGGHLEVVKKLLAAGADVDGAAAGYRGRTALQAASEGGHLEVVEKLLAAGADVDGAAAGYRGRTALQAASERGYLEIVEKLLVAGADTDSKDTDGRTPLSCAAENGHEAIVKLLLATGKVDVDSKDTEGRTSLSWAAEKGFQAVVELLSTQNPDSLRSLSGNLSADTGSDVSNDSSVFSTSSSVPSTTPSSIPGSDNVDYALQAAAEHLAYLLSEDLSLRPLYSQALRTMDKDRFFRNHDRLLKKFMIELRRKAEDDMVIRAVRALRNRRQRERVTTQIYRTFQPDTANTNRKGMRDFLEQKEDRKYRLKLLLEQQGHERGTAERDNVPEANNSAPAAGDVKVEEEIHENEESGSAPDEEVEDEDEGEETEDESDDAPNAGQRLDLVVDFITNSPPFEAFKSNIHYFVNPPTTIKEAIGSKRIKALKQLLRTRFDLLATGEYSWLQELNDMGLNHDEMADLLFQQVTDSPWIYFEPETINPTEIKIGHHLHGCVHQLNLLDKPKTGSTALHQGSFQTGDWSDCIRTVQELCGLGGITPKTRCLEKWNGSVTFEEDHSTACVSYAHQDEQVIFSRVTNALHQFCIAIGHAQSAGLCCDSFTILRYPGRHPKDGSSLIEVCRIDFQLVVLMLDELEQLVSAKGTPNFKKTRALEVLDILLDGASIGPSPETLTGALHSYSLAVQLLCLGFLSYSQAHVGPLRPFFLDTLVTKVRLLGIKMSPAPYQYIDASLKALTCFGDMVEGPVLAFSMVTPKPSTPSPIGLRSGFDLLTSAQDLVDTWGPGQFVVPDGKKHPSAIRIGGGFVYLCISGPDSGKFHWSRTVTPGLFCHGEFDLRRKIVIGAIVTVNDACGLDESSCRASLSGYLQPLGTSLPGLELKEVQVGGQFGNYALIQANASYHMFPGQTLKKKRLDMNDGELIPFLEELWGVQMSLCTAIARRVLLHDMIADLLPVFARRLTSGDEYRLWEDLRSCHCIIENFRSGKVLGWVQELPRPAHDLVLKLVRRVLNTLQDTGLDRNGKALMVAWPYGNDSCHGCRIACEGESSWARALTDSHDSATFAYISATCLETEEIKCSGTSWQWKNTIPLLETAVMVEMTSTSVLAETLQNERIYSFRMLQNPLLVKARKPNASGTMMLVEKKSKIPAQVRQRWNEMTRTHKVLRERRGAYDRAELVVVLSMRPAVLSGPEAEKGAPRLRVTIEVRPRTFHGRRRLQNRDRSSHDLAEVFRTIDVLWERVTCPRYAVTT
ncbi:unnamed protein product [Fusarium graminearum]|nr:unnamed protein product [Fusarium graminearum]